MELAIFILAILSSILIIYLILQHKKYSKNIESLTKQNAQFLESIEKYVEILNEQNVHGIIEKKDSSDSINANKKVQEIRDEYRLKLISKNNELTEEHEMLIDFVTLALSLLIKTPPNLRARLIEDNTDNQMIKKILNAKLSSIEKHYIPVSLLEVAISKEVD